MPSLNEVKLMGHLGQDAETKFTAGGISVTNFSLATTRSWKVGEEWKEETDWHRIVAWRLHEKLLNVLNKGNLVMVCGRLQTRQYEQNGEKRYITEVVADRVLFLREPHKGGFPREADAPSVTRSSEQPPSDDDVPF